ncbi:TPA: hypothetical protein N0F65_003330 [Lagenidium giganteum]|uniref:Uncharacterized protein n=1 Tax=Lagenidium giganteum TaxID=4803 RepID=A0AAV2Z7X2_9STRA|nr:TPA: hypothetical protein N0F65_003330 [Lagenidium giganteum]
MTYALNASDVVRSGLAVDNLSTLYRPLEGSTFVYFGPFASQAAQIAWNQTTGRIDGAQGIWGYKFDTTSIALRAFAQYLVADQWPACVFYEPEDACPYTSTLPKATVFAMLDALAGAVANRTVAQRGIGIQLATKHRWRDRLHHTMLTSVFFNDRKRTNFATYFPSDEATSKRLCLLPKHQRPQFCRDYWLNHKRSCKTTNPACLARGMLDLHIRSRVQTFQKLHPNTTVDLTIIEGSERLGYGGISFEGRRAFDVATIMRARRCSDNVCQTLAIDDFRYEGTIGTSAVGDYRLIITILRGFGQGYAWVRLALVIVGCVVGASSVKRNEEEAGRPDGEGVLSRSWRWFLSIPTSVVCFGSILPMLAYTLAFLLDSNINNEMIAQKFATPMSQVLQTTPIEFCRIASRQMRNLWPLIMGVHLLSFLKMNRATWSPVVDGIAGIAGILPYTLSCLTVFAHYRSYSYRDTRVLAIRELVPSERISLVQRFQYDNARSWWMRLLLGGDMIDHKCLLCLVTLSVSALVLLRVVMHVLRLPMVVAGWHYSPAPVAAGALWPVSILSVSWEESFFMQRNSSRALQKLSRGWSRANSIRVQPDTRDIKRLNHERCVLVNIVAMTEPLILMQMRTSGNAIPMVFIRHRVTRAVTLVPQEVFASQGTTIGGDSDSYEVLKVTQASELAWTDLMQCA